MNLIYLISLRLAATEAGVEEITTDGSEIVVRFATPRVVDTASLERSLRTPIRARSNQLRLPLGRGTVWTATLRDLVDRLQAEPAVAKEPVASGR